MNIEKNRRRFLKYLGSSPLLAVPGYLRAQDYSIPANPVDALNVMDFEAAARRVLELLRAELTLTMRQAGTPSIRQIGKSSVISARQY